MSVKIPIPSDWLAIKEGSDQYPKLYDFEGSNGEQIELVNSCSRKDLISGKGPASYEEAHRSWSCWRQQIDQACGVKSFFRRIKSADEVEKIRQWTVDLLEIGISPAEYLEEFTANVARMRTFDLGRYTVRYALADSTRTDILAKTQAKRAGYGKQKSSIHSYESANEYAVKAKKILSEKNIESDLWGDDRRLNTIIEAARQVASGSPSFIPKPIREAVNSLVDLFKK